MKKLLLLCILAFSSTAMAQKITATSWLVADGNGQILESQNAQETRSIASITKLMTAMVILDAGQDLNEKINGATRGQLLQYTLIKSNNEAADVLCKFYPFGRSACLAAMNRKAESLGLQHTRFADPTGLNIMNVSTAEELVKLVLAASQYPEIVESSRMPYGKISQRKRTWQFNNTNPLVSTHDFIVSKTGYIRASGGSIVMMLNTEIGQRIVVLLNSKDTKTRIPEAKLLSTKF
jgi:D-alanyl-D-alanine endopeptidase (penicillin-binding protein 7)